MLLQADAVAAVINNKACRQVGKHRTMECSSQAKSCSFNGETIASGQVVTAYLKQNVKAERKCESQIRTCMNGRLSGSYQYASCDVQVAAPTPMPDSTPVETPPVMEVPPPVITPPPVVVTPPPVVTPVPPIEVGDLPAKDFLINQTGYNRRFAQVTALSDGTFLSVFQQEDSGYMVNVHAQLIDASGKLISADYFVSTGEEVYEDQRDVFMIPALAASSTGAVVAWRTTNGAVRISQFNLATKSFSVPFTAYAGGSDTDLGTTWASIAVGSYANGNSIVAFPVAPLADRSQTDIKYAVVNSAGNALVKAAQNLTSSKTGYTQNIPRIAMSGNQALLAYHERNAVYDDAADDATFNMVDSSGNFSAAKSAPSEGDVKEWNGEVVTLKDGRFVFVWECYQRQTMELRTFDASTGQFSNLVTVRNNIYAGLEYPRVAALPDGGFAITYLDHQAGIIAEVRYNANLSKVGDIQRVNSNDGKPWNAVVAANSSGVVLFVFTNTIKSTDVDSVYGHLMNFSK